jgi:hypothetical protein
MKQAQVRLLTSKHLDFQQWDNTVRRAPYGLSWWLDAVTRGQWYGLILDDYRVVMPLPVSRTLGPLKLINGAPFTQHQGPFGDYDDEDVTIMINAIPSYWYVRKLGLYPPPSGLTGIRKVKLTPRTNHELSLQPDYEKLVRGYRGNLRLKLRDFPATELQNLPLTNFLEFYRKHVGSKFKLEKADFKTLQRLTTSILSHEAGNCYHLTDKKGETIAAVCLVHHGNRIFNLLAASSPQGFELHGMARLLDGIIRTYAGTDTVLDFEGSDLPGIALFFRGFGAKPVRYWQLGR